MPFPLSMARPSTSLLACCLLLAAVPSTSRGEFVYATSFSTGELIRFHSSDPVNTRTEILAPGTLDSPTGLAFGADGHLYVGVNGLLASDAPSIVRVNLSDNSFTTAYTFATFDVFPAAVVFRGDDLLVGRNPFVGNAGPIVALANIINGPVSQNDYTSGGGLASSPGLALAADGTLYVSDQTYDFITFVASGPVKRFDPTGAYVEDVIADGGSGLAGPTGLAILGDTLFTASIMNGQILATDLTTDSTMLFADTTFSFAVGPLALLGNGQLLSGDPSGFYSSIFHFDTDGSIIGTYALGLGQVGGITVAPVPEPSTLALVGMGVVGGAALLRRRHRRMIQR